MKDFRRSGAIRQCTVHMREQAPQVHVSLERMMDVSPRLGELILFPKLVEMIVDDLPAHVAMHLSPAEKWCSADILARRILFSLNQLRFVGHKPSTWHGQDHVNIYKQIEDSLDIWQKGSPNWVALTNALHFTDRLLGTLWRDHCDHRHIHR